jgi:HEAT repeat protein
VLKFENRAVRTAAIASLAKLNWKPGPDESGAYYWIIQRQWDRCVEIGPAAVDPLIAALKDPELVGNNEPQARRAAIRALGLIGGPAVKALIAALRYESEEVTKAAVEALGQIGSPAVKPLIAALSDEYYNVCMAAEALGRIGDTRAVEPLIATLQNQGWYMIRRAAAESLGRIGDARAVEPLIPSLTDEYFKVRAAAAESLIKIGPPAVEPLIAKLQAQHEWRMRKASIEVLGRIGDGRAVEPLIAALADEDKDVRQTVAWGLISLSQNVPLDDAVKERVLSVFPAEGK